MHVFRRFKSLLATPQLWRVALWTYWIAMFLGTHSPGKIPNLSGGVFDKIVHLGAFAGLGLLFAVNWQLFGGHLTFRHYLAIVFVLAVYAAVDETSQIVVHRDCSLADWASDVTGAAIGVTTFHVGREQWKRWAR